MRIGILGGTFNPVHFGHLAIAHMSMEKFALSKVLFVPSYLPPHKTIQNLASAKHRMEMVRLATADNAGFEVSDLEIKRRGKSYTVDTLEILTSRQPPGTEFFFIVGQDNSQDLGSWKRLGRLLELAKFIEVNRPGCPRTNQSGIKTYSVVMPGIDISSSYLRQRVSQGKSIKYLVPEKVFQYIKQQKLYYSGKHKGVRS